MATSINMHPTNETTIKAGPRGESGEWVTIENGWEESFTFHSPVGLNRDERRAWLAEFAVRIATAIANPGTEIPAA